MEFQTGVSDFGIDYSRLPATPKTPKRAADRFIPNRGTMDMDIASYNLSKENATENANPLMGTPSKDAYKECLAESLFADAKNSVGAKVLAFKSKAPAPKECDNAHKVLYTANKTVAAAPKVTRQIPAAAERVLDAPGFVNDYYLNLVDWSAQNVVAVALGSSLYLWNAATGDIKEFMKTRNEADIVTSVQWTKDGNRVAVGISNGTVELWDAERQKAMRVLRSHSARVGCLAWNNFTLSTGSRDTSIHNHDVRIQSSLTSAYENHTQEICGLKWSDDGLQLASGGNDNVVNVWDVNQLAPKHTFTAHTAAVKALAWCPWQKDLLATGGGSADRQIRFWNTNTGACLNSVDTGSQVNSLQWAQNCKELVSAHGYAQNQLCVWKYPSLACTAELRGHTDRVMSLCMSPDGKTVLSASADETLRFWRVFDVEASSKKAQDAVRPASSIARSINLR